MRKEKDWVSSVALYLRSKLPFLTNDLMGASGEV